MKKTSTDQPFHYKSKRIDISGISKKDRHAVLIDITGFWLWKLLVICIPLILALFLNKHENRTSEKRQPAVKHPSIPDTMRKKITIALVDDHGLFRTGVVSMINDLDPDRYKILFEASSGTDLLKKLSNGPSPDLLLLDIRMPEIDGFETARILAVNYPLIKVIVLSMLDEERDVLKMLKHGVKGYVRKDCEPHELKKTIMQVYENGQFFPEWIANLAIRALNGFSKVIEAAEVIDQLNDKELQFVKLMATDMNYQEIADQMGVSYKSVDKYRESLFAKFQVKSRVGLVLVLVKNGIITRDTVI